MVSPLCPFSVFLGHSYRYSEEADSHREEEEGGEESVRGGGRRLRWNIRARSVRAVSLRHIASLLPPLSAANTCPPVLLHSDC